MYNAKRDGEGEGACKAIPSLGDVEGRITVLEVVASTSLRLALQAGDKHAAQQALSTVRKAVRAKCNEMHLSAADSKSAIEYAQELIEATFADMKFSKPLPPGIGAPR